MANNNGRITSPISLHADVYPVLGISKSGTYYDVGYACGNSHGKINKWSRHKPVVVNTPQELADTQFEDVNFGLSIPESDTNYLTAINNASYPYEAPTPGADWCRLTDFNKYSHTAVSPLVPCKTINFDRTFIDEDHYTFQLTLNHYGHDDYNIGLDEFPGLSDMYFACIIEFSNTGSSTKYHLFKTAATTIGEGGFSINFSNLYSVVGGSGTYYFCAASKAQTTQTSLITGVDFTGLPFNSPSEAGGTFRISASTPLVANLLGATDDPTGDFYIKRENAVAGDLAYPCDANTGLWMQCEITNRASSSYTISIPDLEGELRPSWDLDASDDYTSSTTGYITMQAYGLSGGTWTKLSESGHVTIEPGKTETLRIGHPQWSRYNNGTRGTSVKANRIVDYCEVNIIDRKSGMQVSHPGCRINFH